VGLEVHRRNHAMRALLREASLEPSVIFSAPPLPRVDLEQAISSLAAAEMAWLRLLRNVEMGSMPNTAVLTRFRIRATNVLERALEVIEHMLMLVEPPPETEANEELHVTALPPTLHVLQVETQAAWQRFDEEWTPLLAKELLGNGGDSEETPTSADFVRWLSLPDCIAQLDSFCRHLSHTAERLANVVMKQQPSAALLPKPRDLYRFQLEV